MPIVMVSTHGVMLRIWSLASTPAVLSTSHRFRARLDGGSMRTSEFRTSTFERAESQINRHSTSHKPRERRAPRSVRLVWRCAPFSDGSGSSLCGTSGARLRKPFVLRRSAGAFPRDLLEHTSVPATRGVTTIALGQTTAPRAHWAVTCRLDTRFQTAKPRHTPAKSVWRVDRGAQRTILVTDLAC